MIDNEIQILKAQTALLQLFACFHTSVTYTLQGVERFVGLLILELFVYHLFALSEHCE